MKYTNNKMQYHSEMSRKDNNIYYNNNPKFNSMASLKENSKQNYNLNPDEEYYLVKNENNDFLQMKSVSFKPNKKMYKNNGILSGENLNNLLNQYINFSLHKKKKSKIAKLKKEENKDNKENNEDKEYLSQKCQKQIYMEHLIKKGIMVDVKNLKNVGNKSFKDKLTQKKKDFLNELGIGYGSSNSSQENSSKDIKDISNKNNYYNYYKDENDKKYYNTLNNFYSTNNRKIKFYSPNHNNIHINLHIQNNVEISSDKENKKIQKPKINQFEYIHKIKKEINKIKTEPNNYLSVQAVSPKSKINHKIMSPKLTTTLNDSFRHTNKKKIKQRNYSNSINHKNDEKKINLKKFGKKLVNLNIKTKDEFCPDERKTHRSPEELDYYIKNKKFLRKKKAVKNMDKKYRDLFHKFKNLCTLNNNFSLNNNHKGDKRGQIKYYSPKSYNTISILTSNFRRSIKKKKSPNPKTLLANEPKKNLNSTLIDANEYYLNILESKKLIRNHIYNKTEFNYYKNLYKKEEAKNDKDEDTIHKNIFPIKKDTNKNKDIIKKISKKILDVLIKAKNVFTEEKNVNNENENKNNISDEKQIEEKNNKKVNIKIDEDDIKKSIEIKVEKKPIKLVEEHNNKIQFLYDNDEIQDIEKEKLQNILNKEKAESIPDIQNNNLIKELNQEVSNNNDNISKENEEIINENNIIINQEEKKENEENSNIKNDIINNEPNDENQKNDNDIINKEEKEEISCENTNEIINEEEKEKERDKEEILDENMSNLIKEKENENEEILYENNIDIVKEKENDKEEILESDKVKINNEKEKNEIIVEDKNEEKIMDNNNEIKEKDNEEIHEMKDNNLNKEINKEANIELNNEENIEEFKEINKDEVKEINKEQNKEDIEISNNNINQEKEENEITDDKINKINPEEKVELNSDKKEVKNEDETINNSDNKQIENIVDIESQNKPIINNYINNTEDNKIKEKKKISKDEILNLINVVNKSLKKRAFNILYKYYIQIVIIENYFIGIKYVIAICKKYPFMKLKRNLYNFQIFTALKNLINPFRIIILKEFFNKLKNIPKKQNEIFYDSDDLNISFDDTKEKNNNKDININDVLLEEKNINKPEENKSEDDILTEFTKNHPNIQNNININEKAQNETMKNNHQEKSENININMKTKEKNILNEKEIEQLTDEILQKIISMEIKSKDVLMIPKKKFKFRAKLKNIKNNSSSNSTDNLIKENKLLDLSNLSQLSDENLSALNDSIMEAYTQKSFFFKSVMDKKKFFLIKFYQRKIAPKLIELIEKEIKLKYDRIYNNICRPYKNNSNEIMISLILQDADMLRDNFKIQEYNETIADIIDKENLLKKFEPINIKIREHWQKRELKKGSSKSNQLIDNNLQYDQYMNKCLVECAIELINCERKYGENGDPLIWSSRNRELIFKYPKNDPKKLCDFISKNLFKFLKQKNGLICENYENLPGDIISSEREKRLINTIKAELDDGDYLWRNLEMEETQIKVEVSDTISEQLYNEVIEILEHIQLSRTRGELYQYKSIYACDEMPKLGFQQTTTTENADNDDNDNNILFNKV